MLKGMFFAAGLLCALAAPGGASAGTVAVATATVNLRAGPGTGYPVVATVPAGSQVSAWGCVSDFGWCDVSWGANRGWMAAAYMQTVYGGNHVAVGPVVARRVGLAVVAFNRAYWARHHVGRPWYRRWNACWRHGAAY